MARCKYDKARCVPYLESWIMNESEAAAGLVGGLVLPPLPRARDS